MVKIGGMARTNEEWLTDLTGANRDQAIQDLHQLLVRGLRFTLSSQTRDNVEQLAEDFAQEAVLKILDKLDSFRGESQFTTWAQKIAARVAFTELRRKRWQDSSLEELTQSRDGLTLFDSKILADSGPGPEELTTQQGMVNLVRRILQEELTERQREAMVAVMINGVPLEIAAEQLNTNRNALYKLLHDARLKMKQGLERENLTAQDVLSVFEK